MGDEQPLGEIPVGRERDGWGDTAVQEARDRLGALLKDDDAAAYYPGMPEDVRALLASEAALREENERLREALNDAINAPKGVVPNSADPFYNGRTGKIAALTDKPFG